MINFSTVEESNLKTITPVPNHNQSSYDNFSLMMKMNEKDDPKLLKRGSTQMIVEKKSERDEIRESTSQGHNKATPMTRLQTAVGERAKNNFQNSYSNFFNINEPSSSMLPLGESNNNINGGKEKNAAVSNNMLKTGYDRVPWRDQNNNQRAPANSSKPNDIRIFEKAYLRLLVSKIKAHRVRENEQKSVKKTKQDFLNRANSAQTSTRISKNSRASSNPSIRPATQEQEVVSFKIYAYQNASNAQEKDRKHLINKICSTVTQENFFKPQPQVKPQAKKAVLKFIANPMSARPSVKDEDEEIKNPLETKKIDRLRFKSILQQFRNQKR